MKYVLVRPMGGLANMLNEIFKCYEYAKSNGRELIIDTIPTGFSDDFFKYFIPKEDLIKPISVLIDQELSFYPNVKDELFRYKPVYIGEKPYVPDTNREMRLTFDFSKNYEEDCLVHHAVADRTSSADKAMKLFNMKDDIIDEYRSRRERLPESYHSLHIRATDKTSDYQRYVEENIHELLKCEVTFLATDNSIVIDEIRKSFPEFNFVTFSENISIDGQPIHNRPDPHPYSRNLDALVDLLLLVNSSRIFAPVVRRWHRRSARGGRFSSFTELALSLQSDPDFINSIDRSSKRLA